MQKFKCKRTDRIVEAVQWDAGNYKDISTLVNHSDTGYNTNITLHMSEYESIIICPGEWLVKDLGVKLGHPYYVVSNETMGRSFETL